MIKNIKNKEKVLPKGTHIFNFFKLKTDRAKKLEKWIEEITARRAFIMSVRAKKRLTDELQKELSDLSEKYQFCIEELRRKFKIREKAVFNITTTAGRTVSAQLLAGTYGSTGAVTHCAVGDDNTAAAVGQTTLVNETNRKALSDGNTNGAQTLLETYFTTSEAIDTHEEYAFFIDGTAAADSGEMFNRFTEQNVKSGTESMNIQSTIDWNDG